jgi:energy-coupling factor transporter ATP-binding protein EcfA2
MSAASEGDLEAPPAPQAALERPIHTAAEDKLERGTFIGRLCDAVISRHTEKATGIIIGITGPWGSGKSSILNLLDGYIRKTHGDAIVVRFDPWLISGRNDLIAEFIAELIAELRQSNDETKRFQAAISKLVDYGNTLSPLATLVPYGTAVKDALKMAKDHLDRQKSLHEQRRELMEALARVAAPIVVLIDELDRIEDEEIRIVAQLVRSVADFPGISYVLAYDAERVMRALGGSEKLERGRAYLEKIVQLQIPLPVLMDDEIHRLIEADLDPLCDEGLIPGSRAEVERYAKLRGLLVPRLIATPRDAKRLTGTFSILVRMLTGEVDWIDLLGFCALLVKAPLTVEQIKRDPDAVVDDPTSVEEIVARASERQLGLEALLERVNPEREGGAEVRRLLGFLFSRLSDDRADQRYDRPQGISVCRMRPLLITLRLDLVPGFFSRDAVLDLFGRPSEQVTAFLRAAYDENRIGHFVTKLEDMRDELKLTTIEQQLFWLGASAFLKKPDTEYLVAYSPMYEIVMRFAAAFLKITGLAARDLFLDLVSEGEVEITASLMRSHIFHHALFGCKRSDGAGVFLDGPEAEAIARKLAAQHRAQHLDGRFLWSLWQLNPVYTMINAGVWDEACCARLTAFLTDPKAVDALTLMFFGNGYTTSRETIAKFLDLDNYLRLVDERLEAADFDGSVRLALQKAKDPIFG